MQNKKDTVTGAHLIGKVCPDGGFCNLKCIKTVKPYGVAMPFFVYVLINGYQIQ